MAVSQSELLKRANDGLMLLRMPPLRSPEDALSIIPELTKHFFGTVKDLHEHARFIKRIKGKEKDAFIESPKKTVETERSNQTHVKASGTCCCESYGAKTEKLDDHRKAIDKLTKLLNDETIKKFEAMHKAVELHEKNVELQTLLKREHDHYETKLTDLKCTIADKNLIEAKLNEEIDRLTRELTFEQKKTEQKSVGVETQPQTYRKSPELATEIAELKRYVYERDRTIRELEMDLRNCESDKRFLTNRVAELEALRESERRSENVHASEERYENTIRQLRREIHTLQNDIEQIDHDRRQLREKLLEHTNEQITRRTHRETARSDYEREIHQLHVNEQVLREELRKCHEQRAHFENLYHAATSHRDTNRSSLDGQIDKYNLLLHKHKEQNYELERVKSQWQDSDAQLTSATREIEMLKQDARELRTVQEDTRALKCERDNLLVENRRLQHELNNHLRERQHTQTEIERLKNQLQQYVATVEQTEEVLAAKESEQCELLERFKTQSKTTVEIEERRDALEKEYSLYITENKLLRKKLTELEEEMEKQTTIITKLEDKIRAIKSERKELECELRACLKQRTAEKDERATVWEKCRELEAENKRLDDQVAHLKRLNEEFQHEINTLRRRLDDYKRIEEQLDECVKEKVDLKLRLGSLERSRSRSEVKESRSNPTRYDDDQDVIDLDLSGSRSSYLIG